MVVGAFLGGPLTWLLIKSILKGSLEAFILSLFLFLVFGIIGIGLFLAGLFGFSTRKVMEFDGKTFCYRQTSIIPFFRKAWDEPLSGYEGVLMRSEYDSDNQPSTLYIIELIHPDDQRQITLRQSGGLFAVQASCEAYSRQFCEAYCRQLGLPALKQDGEKYTQRALDDLDKSVRELAVEGKLDITFDPAATVPDELEFNIRGDQLEVEICQPKKVRWWMLMLFVFPVTFICAGFEGNIVSVIIGIVIGVPMVWRYQVWSSTTSLVRINRKGIHYPEPHPWEKAKGRHIRADAIKNVRVGKASPEQSFSSVVVETDAINHAIGEGLNEDALEWLKNCIFSKIVVG